MARVDTGDVAIDPTDPYYDGGPFLHDLDGNQTSGQTISTQVSVTGGCVRSDALSFAIANGTLTPTDEFIMTPESGPPVMPRHPA